MDKLKVTIDFKNKLCDRLYNGVEKAENSWFDKLNEIDDIEIDYKVKMELIEDVNNVIYSVIKEMFEVPNNNIGCIKSESIS